MTQHTTVFQPTHAFSGFSVKDLSVTKEFYSQKLGLKVKDEEMGLRMHLSNGSQIFIYAKPDHLPATYTILNFVVENIDTAIDALMEKGIEFEQYNREDLPQDERGVLRGLSVGMGPDIAWFTDPSGNVLSLLQEK